MRLMHEYGALATRVGVPATAYVCLCRKPRDVLSWFTSGRATLVIGGARGSALWTSDEQHLARTLEEAGHLVVFVESGRTDTSEGGRTRSEEF